MNRFLGSTIIFLFSEAVALFLFSGVERTVVVLALLVVYLSLFGFGVAVLRMNFFCRSVCRGKREDKAVALTFDDGPDPEATPAVLSVLARYGIKAAFFCIGENVTMHPALTRRIVDEGHIIANHGYRHFWWTNFNMSGGLAREMSDAQRAIQVTTGKTPAFFRPLAGLTNPHIDSALRQNHLTCIGWTVRPFDTQRNKKQIVRTIARKARAGAIVLLHDRSRSSEDMTDLLEDVISVLKKGGYSFSALDELIELAPYRENAEGTDVKPPAGIRERLARTEFIRKALADEVTLDMFKERPSARFIAGLSLMAFSYVIGWPAVAFFAFLAVYLDVKKIALLGPASYILSHFVFLGGAALAGVDGVKYGRLFSRWLLHRFARRVVQGSR